MPPVDYRLVQDMHAFIENNPDHCFTVIRQCKSLLKKGNAELLQRSIAIAIRKLTEMINSGSIEVIIPNWEKEIELLCGQTFIEMNIEVRSMLFELYNVLPTEISKTALPRLKAESARQHKLWEEECLTRNSGDPYLDHLEIDLDTAFAVASLP